MAKPNQEIIARAARTARASLAHEARAIHAGLSYNGPAHCAEADAIIAAEYAACKRIARAWTPRSMARIVPPAH